MTVTPQMQLALYFFALLALPAILVALTGIEPRAKRRWVLLQLVLSWLGFAAFLVMLGARQVLGRTDHPAD